MGRTTVVWPLWKLSLMFSASIFNWYFFTKLVTNYYMYAAAAAAKSFQSCPTLCDPIDGSPPGSPSLGFSRQEHWSGLPFPSPMHESETRKWSRSALSNSSRPHGLQPTRLLRPWDFPGKSTGVGCHCACINDISHKLQTEECSDFKHYHRQKTASTPEALLGNSSSCYLLPKGTTVLISNLMSFDYFSLYKGNYNVLFFHSWLLVHCWFLV